MLVSIMFYINPMNVSCHDFDWVHVIALNEFAYMRLGSVLRSKSERGTTKNIAKNPNEKGRRTETTTETERTRKIKIEHAVCCNL